MSALVITLFVLWSGWHAYRSAKKSGTWSNKVFFGVLVAALAFTCLISIPIYLLPSSTTDAHFGLVLTCMLLAVAIAVTVITIYANRWWKAELLRRAGKDQTLGVVILLLLLFSVAGSA
jgi:Kef-type K+ transport system membrane component KefB